jgi:hypothetical protein
MSVSDTGKTKRPLPGLSEQATTGEGRSIAPTCPPTTHPAAPAAPKKTPRRTKALEDIDSDYAEEAEDFFYGEGM